MTDGVDEIRMAARTGDVYKVAKLTLEHLEPGTPILSAYLMLQTVAPLLPPEIKKLVRARLDDTGIGDAALLVVRDG